MLATMFLSTMPSCKKDEAKPQEVQNQEIVDSEANDCPADGFSKGRTNVKPNKIPVQSIPYCVQQFANEYGDLYDFSQLLHINELDTTGYYIYAAPSRYFTNCLIICADRNEIVLSFSFDLGENFDIDDILSGGPLEIYAMTPDWSDLMFWCVIDFSRNELNMLYVNEYLLNTRSKFLNPSQICGLVVGTHAAFAGWGLSVIEGIMGEAAALSATEALAVGIIGAASTWLGVAIVVGSIAITTFVC